MVDFLLVLDFESTSVDPQTCRVLEVAATLVSFPGLDLIDSYTAVIDHAAPDHLAAAKADPIVGPMHTANGLFDDIDAGRGIFLHEAEAAILSVLDRHGSGAKNVALAGSGVAHFDLQVIAARMPALHTRLAYWTLDIGPIRRAIAAWVPTEHRPADTNATKSHRAADDVACHLADLITYRDFFRSL